MCEVWEGKSKAKGKRQKWKNEATEKNEENDGTKERRSDGTKEREK
jgi:hypothetical protein